VTYAIFFKSFKEIDVGICVDHVMDYCIIEL